jgi:hypothetical protein
MPAESELLACVPVAEAPPVDLAGQAREGATAALVLAGEAEWHVGHGDVLEYLRGLPEQSVDLIVGSPPYDGKARRYGSGKNLKGQEWVDWMVEVFEASLRACRGLVAYVVDGSTRDFRWSCTPALLCADLHRKGIHLRKPPAYVRHGIPGSGGKDWLKNNYEQVVCATAKGGALPWSDNTACGKPPVYKRSGPFTNRRPNGERNHRAYTPPPLANPGNVIACKVGGNQMGSRLAHNNEAPFPEALPAVFIRSFCRPGGVVCDPFSGSGTTGAVACRWGRRFLGCDVRPEQVSLARERIALACSLAGRPEPPAPRKPRDNGGPQTPKADGEGGQALGPAPAASRPAGVLFAGPAASSGVSLACEGRAQRDFTADGQAVAIDLVAEAHGGPSVPA